MQQKLSLAPQFFTGVNIAVALITGNREQGTGNKKGFLISDFREASKVSLIL